MSTILTEIERAYYKSINAVKVTELEHCTTGQGTLRYPKDAFLRWVRKINIYDLEKHKADFSLDKETEYGFGEYRHEVEDGLRESFQYVELPYSGVNIKGALQNIGSCHDGSKVEKVDEVDNFYVLEGDNIIVKPSGNRGLYRIFWQRGCTEFEIHARSLRNQFADACDKIVSDLQLRSCLRHGGYNSPQYSGLRYNGPAATAQYLTEDDSLLTLDITPTFCLPRKENMYHDVKELLHRFRDVISDKMLDKPVIHLIPDGAENLWRLSTAHLEANILRILPKVAPIKQALSYCKILLSKLKKWNAQHCEGFTSGLDDIFGRIMTDLDKCVEGSCQSKEITQRLNKALRYAHICIPHGKRKLYHEDQKSYVSINNAAVKYILLTAAIKQPEAFCGKENMNLVVKLMKHVFDVLGNTAVVSSPHTFQKIVDVPHLSILAILERHNVPAAGLLIKEQCRILASETTMLVGDKYILDNYI